MLLPSLSGSAEASESWAEISAQGDGTQGEYEGRERGKGPARASQWGHGMGSMPEWSRQEAETDR